MMHPLFLRYKLASSASWLNSCGTADMSNSLIGASEALLYFTLRRKDLPCQRDDLNLNIRGFRKTSLDADSRGLCLM
jgi:hypothetical protein